MLENNCVDFGVKLISGTDMTSGLYWFIYKYAEYLKATLNGKKK